MHSILTLKDVFLTPLYLLAVYIIIIGYRNLFIKNPVLKKHFLPAISLKIFGGIFLGLIYEFYYGGGDTMLYYKMCTEIYTIFFENPLEGLTLIFNPNASVHMDNYSLVLSHYAEDTASYIVARVAAIFSFFCFNTYSVIALFFGVLNFTGVWLVFQILYKEYPKLEKQFAIAFLYMPSIFFWGSGVMKDGLALTALCICFYCLYQLAQHKTSKIYYFILLALSIYILSLIKVYIILCFFPPALFWFGGMIKNKIRNRFFRLMAKPLIYVICIAIGIYVTYNISSSSSTYNLETILETAKSTSTYIGGVSREVGGSYYTLGDYEPTLSGVLPKAPAAIWVTLFRPFLWEVKNPLMLLSSLECAYFFYITFSTIWIAGFFNFFRIIYRSPFVNFSIIYSITFAFAIGISTYNFGTLVRYKIPMIAFYLSAIYIVRYIAKEKITEEQKVF